MFINIFFISPGVLGTFLPLMLDHNLCLAWNRIKMSITVNLMNGMKMASSWTFCNNSEEELFFNFVKLS